MSYFKKIEYEITLKDSFRVIRNCPKCGRKTHFQNTKKFRVNANGNRLDIWLIYQCMECGQRFNLTIYERRKVSSIQKEEYRRFLDNDEELAEMYGRNIQLFQKNRADVDFDRLDYDFVRLQEGTISSCDMSPFTMEKREEKEQFSVIIHNPYRFNIRPEKQVAGVFGLSRSQVKSMVEKGDVEIKMIGGDIYVDTNGQAEHP